MVAGFCTNAAITGMYANFREGIPDSRARFRDRLGRSASDAAGSVLAPIIAGFLFAANFSLPTVSLFMSLGSLVAAVVLLQLRVEESNDHYDSGNDTV
jgi:hypothetical protein